MQYWGWLFIILVLVSGCTEKTITETKYVCSGGSVVLNPRECPVIKPEVVTKIIEKTLFVCFDGTNVTSLEECPKVTTTLISTTSLPPERISTTTMLTTSLTTTIKITTTLEMMKVRITKTQFDAPGNDRENLNDEWVRISNEGTLDADMSKWTLEDEQNHVYVFPDGFVLKTGASAKVHTGSGVDTDDDLYWNRNSPVWNNDGDVATLRDQNNIIVDSS